MYELFSDVFIIEENSMYFVPQALTKIMNEGWAVLIHEKIVKELFNIEMA